MPNAIPQNIDLRFGQGIETKTDPFQIPIGKFQNLVNSVFTTGNRLTKRNGYELLPSPAINPSYVTTFQDSLVAAGTFSSGPGAMAVLEGQNGLGWNTFVQPFQPLNLTTQPIVRNGLNQTQCDVAFASNGVRCVVYTETSGSATAYKYELFAAENFSLPPVLIPALSNGTISGAPRVLTVGTNFVIICPVTILGTSYLQYVALIGPQYNGPTPYNVFAEAYTPVTANAAWDAVVDPANGTVIVAYNTTAGGQGVHVTYLTPALIQSGGTQTQTPYNFAGSVGALVGLSADISTSFPNTNIGIAFFNPSGNDIDMAQFHINPVTGQTTVTVPPFQIFSSNPSVVGNLTLALNGAAGSVYAEYIGNYAYSPSVPNNNIHSRAFVGGTAVGGVILTAAGVGLASKAFYISDSIFFFAAYQSAYQSTYFLLADNTTYNPGNGSIPPVLAKFAYGNGGGYYTTCLPTPYVDSSAGIFIIPYLYKDLVAAVNKGTALASGTQTAGIYSQTGINLVTVNGGSPTIQAVEIGNNLNIIGGITYAYDGQQVIEQGFHLWPDNIAATWTTVAPVMPTGTFAINSTTVTVSSTTGVFVGMSIADTTNAGYILPKTYITAISGLVLTISAPTTAAGTGDSLSIAGIAAQPDGMTNTNAYWIQVTYEYIDNQGNNIRSAPSVPIPVTTTGSGAGTITVHVPALRLTAKTPTPLNPVGAEVNIVIYRWSVAQEIYYQTTSITTPFQNIATATALTFTDRSVDAAILGNNILYTTGGVVENIGPPAFSNVFLFDDRLWGIDAEDGNLLWYSKQVLEATPVEMSDLFTLYVAPSTGAQGPTGPLTCGFPMDDKAILFKKTALAYINGTGPDNTGANSQYSQPIFITSTVGCTNANSIVFTPNGLMFEFQSAYGNQIWLLGRDLSTQYIGAAVENLTKNATVISAVNIPGANHVRFTLSSGMILVYDYYYSQWGTFVFGSTAATSATAPASSTLYQGLHTFINSLGQTYQETPGLYLDGAAPVLLSFLTGWISLAGLQGYERLYWLLFLGNYFTPFNLQVTLGYNYTQAPTQFTTVVPTNYNPTYGEYPGYYGAETPYGGNEQAFKERVFAQTQRCESFQIGVQEIYDPSYGVAAGAGLTLSGITLVAGIKSGWRTSPAAKSFG